MFKLARLTLIFSVVLWVLPVSAQQSGMLELGAKKPKDTIVPIGTVPPKKIIPLNLGALRTEEAQLPPAPLTRTQRMALRAKRAMSRQRAVSNASRQPLAQRHRQPPQKEANYDLDEEIPMGSDGEPVLE